MPKTNNAKKTQQAENSTYSATLKAAAKLFRDQGYAATTLRQIGDAVGIKAGSIYYHFESKEQILDKVLDAGIRLALAEVQQRVNSLPPDATCQDRIAAAIEGHLVGILQHGDFVSANIRVYSQIPAGPKRRHRAIRAVYAAYWDKLLEECRQKGGLRNDVALSTLRLFIIGALNWTVEWFDPRQGSLDAFVAQISTIVFNGILPRTAAAASPTGHSRPRQRKAP